MGLLDNLFQGTALRLIASKVGVPVETVTSILMNANLQPALVKLGKFLRSVKKEDIQSILENISKIVDSIDPAQVKFLLDQFAKALPKK